jgi:hypothetical protein
MEFDFFKTGSPEMILHFLAPAGTFSVGSHLTASSGKSVRPIDV